jgi:hypothetical protein
MTQDEIENQIMRLTAQNLVMRDFISWFLATLSAATSDPKSSLKYASESEDKRIDAMNPASHGQVQMAEMLREEKDWIISAATKILEGR